MIIPTTQQLIDQVLAGIEARLNQSTPAADRAFNVVLAGAIAGACTSIYKYAADRFRAGSVLYARASDLDHWGAEYGIVRKPAVSAVLTLTLTGTNGTVIPSGTVFVADANGEQYVSQAQVTISSGTCSPVVAALLPGTSGNLTVADTLVLQNQIIGATGVPEVASVDTVASDEEADDDYRLRVLDAERGRGGGGNAADYREWAQAVDGVVRAYPYSGQPTAAGSPPDRTVYVECDTSIEPDGIPPTALLDQVRDEVTTDPATGKSRQPLGLTDDTLYVEAISRTSIYLQITGLEVDADKEDSCKAAISAAASAHLLAVTPYVAGLDPEFGRTNTITRLTLSRIVQAVLAGYGASAEAVAFGTTAGPYTLDTYTVDDGEKTKLGGVAYAV